jgi:hypothetical protein
MSTILDDIISKLESSTNVEWVEGDLDDWSKYANDMVTVINVVSPIIKRISNDYECATKRINEFEQVIAEKDKLIALLITKGLNLSNIDTTRVIDLNK